MNMPLHLPIVRSGLTKWAVASLALVMACTIHYSRSTASDYYREFQFYNNPNHILSIPSGLLNSTQMTTKVSGKMACVLACTKSRPWCGSVNFKLQPENDGLHICELLSTDMFTKPGFLNPAQTFTHLSIVNNCKNPSPCQNNGICSPDYDNDEYHCQCNATKGKDCEIFYSDCSVLRSAGYTVDGVYQIDPDGQGFFSVYCDMTTDGGGWTVFQRRENNAVSFTRGWQDYKNGFGNMHGDFWLGLEKIYRLTKRQVTKLRIDLESPTGNKGFAKYSSFSITDASDFYRLRASGYSGTAGDSLTKSSNSYWIANNNRFSTPDKDNDLCASCECASTYGWWFGWCGISGLNGKTWTTFGQILRTEMKLK